MTIEKKKETVSQKALEKENPLAPRGKLVDSREQTAAKKEGQNYSTA